MTRSKKNSLNNGINNGNMRKVSSRKDASPYRNPKGRRPPEPAEPDLRQVVSRKEIKAVTMNMNGRMGLGLTPRYKIDLVRQHLAKDVPDIVLIQDSIDYADIMAVLSDVSNGMYDWHFEPDRSTDSASLTERNPRRGKEDEDDDGGRCVTGIAWNKDKYMGTPLRTNDKRLDEYTKWLKKHDIVIVKMDSAQRANGGAEDVYPSFIAISWYGPDYEKALRQRTLVCEQFFQFLAELRRNNWQIPILIGGDFNMDMKSFMELNMETHKDFLCVPYRPISGSLAKDLRNTFLFTLDSLQVTETSYKQHHPEVFSTPFITVHVRGKTKLRLWAIVKIQRAFRSYARRKREKKAGKKKLKDSKKRWKRKIEGDDYKSDKDSDSEEEATAKHNLAKMSISSDGSGNADPYKKASITNIAVTTHRRKRFDDLISVHERQKEMKKNETFMRSLRKAERMDL